MPQPLSKLVKKPKGFTVTPEPLADKPEFAQLISNIVAASASNDLELNLTMARMMRVDPIPIMAVFNQIRTKAHKRAALFAAGEEVLTADELKMFRATYHAYDRAQADRDRLCHWIWALSEEVPDALLLIDPVYFAAKEVQRGKIFDRRRSHETISAADAMAAFAVDYSKVLVYKLGDLQRAQRDLFEAGAILRHYGRYITSGLSDSDLKAMGLSPLAPGTRQGELNTLSTFRMYREGMASVEASDKSKAQKAE